MDCIDTYYNPVRNMMTNGAEQLIEYGQRKLTDCRKVMENHGNRVMYYLKDGPDRAFVSEELMLISEDTS